VGKVVLSRERSNKSMKSYAKQATPEERRGLAEALMASLPRSSVRPHPDLSPGLLWMSRLCSIPVATACVLAISNATGFSPFSRYSGISAAGVALLLTCLPNYFARILGSDYAERAPRERPLPPLLSLCAGWFFLALVVAFAWALPGAA